MNPKNIVIIGAGPVGCYCGYLLAKYGHQVSIYETHSKIGYPIQCTGLLTADFEKFNIPMDSFLINTFSHVELNSPSKQLKMTQKEHLVSRPRFDNYFATLAKDAGAKIFLQHTFLRKENNNLIIKHKNKEISITPDIVIAADGPSSPTAKAYNFYHPERQNYFGIQAVVEGQFNPQIYHTFFGQEICPGFFAWVVPESSTSARVGLASKKDTKTYFNNFVTKNNFTVTEIQAGMIPLYSPKQKLQQDNCYLVGDAAGFVKATTLGGLVPGLKQAEILADCIINGKDYETALKPLRRKLRLHLRLHNTLEKFSDSDWDRLVSYVNSEKIQKILQKHTRDNPLPLVLKALMKEPRLIRFGKYLI